MAETVVVRLGKPPKHQCTLPDAKEYPKGTVVECVTCCCRWQRDRWATWWNYPVFVTTLWRRWKKGKAIHLAKVSNEGHGLSEWGES